MGRSKEFSIHLDDNKETYFAGEQLSGNVIIHLNEPTSMVRFVLLVHGKAVCKTGTSCNELVYKNDITLFGSMHGSAATNRQHPAGKKSYRFNFLLPPELPSSINEGGGYIKYRLIAKVMFKGILTSDWQVKKPFEVKQILDANIPNYELQHVHTSKRIPTMFQSQKKVEKEDLLFSLERGVYSPGEEVRLHLQYKYVEARKMGLVKCRLNKYGQFNKKVNKTVYKKTVKEQNDTKRSDEKIYQRIITISIPMGLVPTNTLTNAVIVNYVLHVKVEGYKEVKLPIIMGTIPFDSMRTGNSLINQSDMNIQQPSSTTTPSAPPPPPDEFEAIASSSTTPINLYPVIGNSGEIQCDFFHPPPYVPEDEFDLPPSYDDVVQEPTNESQFRLVAA